MGSSLYIGRHILGMFMDRTQLDEVSRRCLHKLNDYSFGAQGCSTSWYYSSGGMDTHPEELYFLFIQLEDDPLLGRWC